MDDHDHDHDHQFHPNPIGQFVNIGAAAIVASAAAQQEAQREAAHQQMEMAMRATWEAHQQASLVEQATVAAGRAAVVQQINGKLAVILALMQPPNPMTPAVVEQVTEIQAMLAQLA